MCAISSGVAVGAGVAGSVGIGVAVGLGIVVAVGEGIGEETAAVRPPGVKVVAELLADPAAWGRPAREDWARVGTVASERVPEDPDGPPHETSKSHGIVSRATTSPLGYFRFILGLALNGRDAKAPGATIPEKGPDVKSAAPAGQSPTPADGVEATCHRPHHPGRQSVILAR